MNRCVVGRGRRISFYEMSLCASALEKAEVFWSWTLSTRGSGVKICNCRNFFQARS